MKMAIIGYGGMGHWHKQGIVARLNDSDYSEKIEVVGVYDIDNARNTLAVNEGIKAYADVSELYADGEVELVLVATPNDVHKNYVIDALNAGKNVIVEKPAAMDSGEVLEMYAAADKSGKVFSPHQNRRWDDDYLTVKKLVNDGAVGRVYRIESRVMGSNGIPGAWRRVKAQGGGMMLDWGVHLIDQMLKFIPGKVTSIYCTYSYEAGEDVDDGFDLEVTFDCGVAYRIVVDTNSFIELPRWQVYGEDGTATVTDWRADKVEGKIVTCVVRKDDKLEGVSAGNGFTKTMAARRSETVAELPLEVVRGDKNAFYVNFVDAIRTGVPTTVQKDEVLRVFKVMELAYQSAHTKTVIKEIF